MITIKEKKKCCGCNACGDVCTHQAISFKADNEGFWYPEVDQSKCVDCGLCESVCPVIHVDELKKNEYEKPRCFAAIHSNIEVRFASTTGGLFSALAEQTYKEGGYVGGAVYREDWSVVHFISNNPNDLKRLRQSKYSQSDLKGFYKEVKRLVKAGEKVLVCGTPCQMAALRRYVGKDYENLVIVDFICKSITSPKFYAKYLDYWERKAGSKLVAFKFKDKELGWRELTKRFDFKNGKTLWSRAKDQDLYSTAYHGNVVSRPSCYDCQFKGFPRIADITIADFWGCEKHPKYHDLDDNAGTSAVIVNNGKGLRYFKSIRNRIKCMDATIEDIVPGNPALLHPQKQPTADRAKFFADLDAMPVEDVVRKHCHYYGKGKQSFKSKLKAFVKPLFLGWKHAGHSVPVFVRFLRLNLFDKHIHSHWMEGGVVYPTPYSLLEMHKGAILELNGSLILGSKKFKKSKVETRLILERNARMTVNNDSHFGYGSDVEVFANASLTIDQCGTNYNCTIICGKRIEMHGHVSLGRDVSIRDTNAHLIALDGYKILRPVVIEHHTWLCSGATICPGVKIKEGSIVGAESYVIQNVPAHCLVSGHPAKVVQKDIAWKL